MQTSFQSQPYTDADARLPSRPLWTLRVAIVSLVALTVWAALAKIDQVTHATAQIIAVAKTQLVQSPDAGIVTRLHVREGDSVKAGQLLVTLEKERVLAAVNDSQAKVAALKITLARLRAEAYGRPLVFDPAWRAYPEYISNQTDLYNKRHMAIDDDVASLRKMLAYAEQELRMNMALESTGDVARGEILRMQRAVADLEAQITNKRNRYFQDVQAEMAKAQEELSTQGEQLRDRSQMLDHAELMAPTDGIVKNIKVTTAGAVIRPGDVIMEILPVGGELVAEAKISPADVGFIKLGQSASVKLDAFDSSIFGAMRGQVSYISADTIVEDTPKGPQPYYRATIRLQGTEFKGGGTQIQVRPGMTASVDIKALERTVLSYLTKPVTKTFSQSLGER